MGYVRCRENKLKKRRYTAVYHDVRGVERSAGTFTRKAAAARAWKSAEAAVADGRYLDVDLGRKRFADYALDIWLPQYPGEDTTVEGYGFYLEKYLIPEFGATRMIEITPTRVRAFYALLRDAGLGRPTIEKCKTVLCSLFNTAVNDRVVGRHPCHGVSTPAVVQAPLRILTPAEYTRLHACLRDDLARLMVDVLLESGCRWGEFAELRVGDLDPVTCTLTIARTVVQVNPKYTPDGESGFRVKEYPKNRHWRKSVLSRDLTDRLVAYFSGRSRDALMFAALGRKARRKAAAAEEPVPDTFKVAGRSFTHGTLYASTKGSCRCEKCRQAVTDYRAARRGQGKDRPPANPVSQAVRETRHMRRDWFRNRVFHPAAQAAGLDWLPRTHDLRHASASWALAGGATVQQVRTHLGHISLRAVERYLHNLPGAEAGACGAIARVKATGSLYPMITPSYTPPVPPQPSPAAATIANTVPEPACQETSGEPTAPNVETAAMSHSAPAPRLEDEQSPAVPVEMAIEATAIAPSETSARHAVRINPSAADIAPELTEDTIEDTPEIDSEVAEDDQESAAELAPRTQRHRTPSHQGTKKNHHGSKTPSGPVRTQDRYIDDRQLTNARTTPQPGEPHLAAINTTEREGRLHHPWAKAPAGVRARGNELAHGGGRLPAAAAVPASGKLVNQPTHTPGKCSAGSAPLTNDGQTIKKPIPSTTGDRL